MVRILTWNLQGRERPDLEAVMGVLEPAGADVIVLQEVQRRQARVLAGALGWHLAWRFKHWPVVFPAEGLAILSPTPLVAVERAVLAHGLAFWSWKRRIAVVATIGPGGEPLRVVDTHLGAGVDDVERARQASLVAGLVGRGGVVAGDMNTAPGSVVITEFARRGLVDGWSVARPGDAGPTNWPPGPRSGPPSQRLDYVLAGADWEVESVEVPAFGDPGFERFGTLSDHLPVTATLTPAVV